MKKILFFSCLLFSLLGQTQERFLTRTGYIDFEASVPSFEPVAAENHSTTVILNPQTGEIAALTLVKAFRFENALMEEHFNENYAESFNYPKATLKGNIVDFSLERLSKKPTSFPLQAQLTFHGVTRPVNLLLEVSKKEDILYIRSELMLLPADFDIDIPGIVRKKVAEQVNVRVDFQLKEK